MKSYIYLIIGMALVTYIPRLIPLMFLTNKSLSPKVKQFLQFIPLTSLSILIVGGILTSSKEMILPTFAGIALAGLISYFKSNLVLSVFTAILASFLIINIF